MGMILLEPWKDLVEGLAVEVAHACAQLAREQLHQVVLQSGVVALRVDIASGRRVAGEHHQLAGLGHGRDRALRYQARVADHGQQYQDGIDPAHA